MFDVQIDVTKYWVFWSTSFMVGFLLVFIPFYIPLHRAKIKNSGKKFLVIGVFTIFAIASGFITLFFANVFLADYFFTRWDMIF